jgi:hypothetical protein
VLAIGHFGMAAIVSLTLVIGMTDPSSASEGLDAAALDRSTAMVTSCTLDEMYRVANDIPAVSISKAMAICEMMTKSLDLRLAYCDWHLRRRSF